MSRYIGRVGQVLRIILSERAAAASLIALVSLILFGILGPLLYQVDPDTVFYRYRVSVYMVDGLRAREVYTLEGISATVSASTDRGFIFYAKPVEKEGSGGSLYLVDLSHSVSKPSITMLGLKSDVSSISIVNNTVILSDGGSIYVAMYSGNALSGLREVLRASSRVEGLIPTNYGIVWWDNTGRINLARVSHNNSYSGSSVIAELGWVPRWAVDCGSWLVFVGPSGRVSVVDAEGKGVKTYQPVFEDLLSAACIDGKVIVTGRYGSTVILSSDTITPVITGVVDDLVHVVPTGGGVLAIGSKGSVVSIDLGTGALSVKELRGISGVKKAIMIDGNLYLLSYGAFVASLEPPSLEHPFGTNYYGKDLMAQIMVGIRMSLLIGVAVAAAVTTIGSMVGMLSGYFRGKVDSIFNTIINFVYTIPLEPFAILLAMSMRPSMMTVIIAISVLIWRTTARIIRSQAMTVASSQMVEAARALGAGHLRIIARYILPAVLPLVLLDFASVIAYAILAEATLGFLGVSAQDTYTLGGILNQARLTGAWRDAWWWVAIPGIFIGSISLSIYMLVRSLEPIANPRVKGSY
ncbi:MAG: ABC transporter permease [Sulfolobales archaeon]